MNGILIVDKPSDWTSHDVVAKLRGALKMKRIGHGGTLDPMATGVLPIFIGTATKLSATSTDANKEYIAGLRLGITTDTQDITGNVVAESELSVAVSDLMNILPKFTGTIQQTPPMYSAKKHKGKKLYELARKGIEVPREPKEIQIHTLELLTPTQYDALFKDNNVQDTSGSNVQVSAKTDSDFLLRVACSKGTYIRTLCHDIGNTLGCGGTMSSLRRTCSGTFRIEDSHTLDNVLVAISNGSFNELLIEVDCDT